MDNLDKISLDMLSGDQLELAECIGLPSYIQLVRQFGGCQMYVAKLDRVVATVRDAAIREEYTGDNLAMLARRYGLAENTIRAIVHPTRRLEGQVSLFDHTTKE